ncbi:MAG: hypothetical protein OHK0046_24330 [Anaerolineae bacterium]
MLRRLYPVRTLVVMMVVLVASACNLQQPQQPVEQVIAQAGTATLTATTAPELSPTSSRPTFTPSPEVTLRPPPTFEPPTNTPQPSNTPSITPTATIQIQGNLPTLQGLRTTEDPNATGEGCTPREDWTLFYEVQANDALASIADRYNTYAQELAEGNCLENVNLIVVGQTLRVPGNAHPVTPQFVCTPWELLTPFNGTITVPGSGTITFNWRGPEAPRYLVRLYRTEDASGTHIREYLTEFKTNYTLDLDDIPEGGLYSWRIFPIGFDFQQIPCQESYHSIFVKEAAPPTPQVPVQTPGV